VGQAVCTSCPQACMTGCSTPSRSVAVAVDAYGRPVRPRTGRAAMSARAMTTGPSPVARTAITPVPPTPSVKACPADRRGCAARPVPVRQDADHPGAPDAVGDGVAGRPQSLCGPAGRAVLPEPEFRVAVQVPVQLLHARTDGAQAGRHDPGGRSGRWRLGHGA